jgi:hypothetical protein
VKFAESDVSRVDVAGLHSRFPEFCNCSLENIAARATTVTIVLNEILSAKGFARNMSRSPCPSLSRQAVCQN